MRRTLLGFSIIVFAMAASRAQSQRLPRPKLAGEDWVELFNGKDLTGWVEVGHEKWQVEDGTIHGFGITKDYGYLKTQKTYKDFQLSLKFKCEGEGGNSGVFFHVDFKPGTADVSQGPQFEIDCTIGHHTAGVYDVGRQWVVWPSPENELVVRDGEWNEYLLKVEANHYVARLNGVQMVDYTDPRPSALDGFIALQLHSGGKGNFRFKDIWIRDTTKR